MKFLVHLKQKKLSTDTLMRKRSRHSWRAEGIWSGISRHVKPNSIFWLTYSIKKSLHERKWILFIGLVHHIVKVLHWDLERRNPSLVTELIEFKKPDEPVLETLLAFLDHGDCNAGIKLLIFILIFFREQKCFNSDIRRKTQAFFFSRNVSLIKDFHQKR